MLFPAAPGWPSPVEEALCVSDAKMEQHEDTHWMWEAELIVPFPAIMKKSSHTPNVHIPSETISLKPTNQFWKWQAWMCIEVILLNFDNRPVSSSDFPGSLLLAVLKVHGHLECIRVIPIASSLKRFWARALANFIFQCKSNPAKDSKLEAFPKPSLFISIHYLPRPGSAKQRNCAHF